MLPNSIETPLFLGLIWSKTSTLSNRRRFPGTTSPTPPKIPRQKLAGPSERPFTARADPRPRAAPSKYIQLLPRVSLSKPKQAPGGDGSFSAVLYHRRFRLGRGGHARPPVALLADRVELALRGLPLHL